MAPKVHVRCKYLIIFILNLAATWTRNSGWPLGVGRLETQKSLKSAPSFKSCPTRWPRSAGAWRNTTWPLFSWRPPLNSVGIPNTSALLTNLPEPRVKCAWLPDGRMTQRQACPSISTWTISLCHTLRLSHATLHNTTTANCKSTRFVQELEPTKMRAG